MDPISGMNTTPAAEDPGGPTIPMNWRTALVDLIGARTALIQLELKQAASSGIRRGVFFAAAALLLLFAWIILVAGGIGAISATAGWPWYWVALSAGGIHLIIAVTLILLAKKPGPATFEVTRAEFKKDREWLANFQSPNRSND